MVNAEYTLKPALRAFPKTWLWIIWHMVMIGALMKSGNLDGAGVIFTYFALPPLLLIPLYRYGRTYTLKNERITFYNRYGGKSESFLIDDIAEMNIKPIAFGAANTEFILRNGSKKIMKNVVPKTRIKAIQNHLRDA